MATMEHTNPVYDVTLPGLVYQPVALLGQWSMGPGTRGAFVLLPASHPDKEARYISLHLPP